MYAGCLGIPLLLLEKEIEKYYFSTSSLAFI
jgi:hypothetical protein